MGTRREIRSFDYINYSYPVVKQALTEDPERVFIEATRTAGSRAQSVAASLQVRVGGLDVSKDISLNVGTIESDTGSKGAPVTRLALEWEAANRPQLFPLMSAELAIYPLTPTETQLDFLGRHDPPMGKLGDALDAVVGRKIAEATVHRFVADVAHFLRTTLGK